MPAKAKDLKWEPYPAKHWVPHNINGTLGHGPFFAKCAEKSQLLQKKITCYPFGVGKQGDWRKNEEWLRFSCNCPDILHQYKNTWVVCDTVLPDKRRVYWLLQNFCDITSKNYSGL